MKQVLCEEGVPMTGEVLLALLKLTDKTHRELPIEVGTYKLHGTPKEYRIVKDRILLLWSPDSSTGQSGEFSTSTIVGSNPAPDATNAIQALMRCIRAADYDSLRWRADLDQLAYEVQRTCLETP